MTTDQLTVINERINVSFEVENLHPALHSEIGRQILMGNLRTKWFNEDAAVDYSYAVATQLGRVKDEIKRNKETRRAIFYCPPGACWVATQFLFREGRWKVLVTYRSMDTDHIFHDTCVQTYIARTTLETDDFDIIFTVGSLHTYEKQV